MTNSRVIYPRFLRKDDYENFQRDGYLIIENFLTETEVNSMVSACSRLIEHMDPEKEEITKFTTDDSQGRSKYFLDSGDKVRFFFEVEALDKNGKINTEKHLALNKIGHSLHWHVPEFKQVTFSHKVKSLGKFLLFQDPAIVQSMYIFKQPNIGGEVSPHKDSTFLSTTPESCVGLWFALEDCTVDNGCLWFWPGSHNTPAKRKFIRNPDKDGPLMTFKNSRDEDDPSKYVAVPVKKGSVILIHGEVSHKSEKNSSPNSRHIYTFHIIERKDTIWSPANWLQPTEELAFTGLYDN